MQHLGSRATVLGGRLVRSDGRARSPPSSRNNCILAAVRRGGRARDENLRQGPVGPTRVYTPLLRAVLRVHPPKVECTHNFGW